MQIKCCLRWALAGLFLMSLTRAAEADDKDDQLLNQISMELPPKPKRPFCNAFTGCGKKRNYDENSLGSNSQLKFDLPPQIYKALIRALTDELRSAVARRLNEEERNSEVSLQDYLAFLNMKRPVRSQMQS